MKTTIKTGVLKFLAINLLLLFGRAYAQISVVNIVPQSQSNQIVNDAEPNVAVNPLNNLQIAASAFTPDPMNGPNAPIYVSTDGGNTWALNSIIPGNSTYSGTGDITLRFGGSSNQLYIGDLEPNAGLTLNILRAPSYTSSTVAQLLLSRNNVDQPYVQAATVLDGDGVGNDRVYITTNDWNETPQPLAINYSLDAFSTAPPAGITTNLFPNRPSTSRVEPGTRPAIHGLGVVYIAFYNSTSAGADVVVARDDNWGTGTTPFQNLLDATDHLPGQRVVTGRNLPAFGVNLGNSRLVASNISITVDPTDAATVYVAWADRVGTTDYTLHVRSSTNSGQSWSSDLLTITNATNPALAVNSSGKLGFIYQALTGSGSTQRWETHLRRSINGGANWDDVMLSTFLLSDNFGGWLGDYEHLIAVGKDFYGIFGASNYPDHANFPQGVTYQRNANFSTHQLLGTDNSTPVGVSLDPFFFHVTELPAADDFYVRDFTNSPTDFDPGLEPSTYPWFFNNSDVWNKRSNAPGGFNSNDQPQSDDPWQVTDGHNYAFTRVHRKATGPAQTVTLHYLYSEFGTGSNFVDANTTSDQTISFGPSDLAITPTTGYQWDLPTTTSNHTCLAVEISTPADPYITPSLVNHAPGWSDGTDFMVLLDNNKAQRNMQVYRIPMGGTGVVSSYAAIHNPGILQTDMQINWQYPTGEPVKNRVQVSVVDAKANYTLTSKSITLLHMQPGETRYLKIDYAPSGNTAGESSVVSFGQIKNGAIVNGFAIAHESDIVAHVLSQNIVNENLVLKRVNALYAIPESETIRKTHSVLLAKPQFSDKEYVSVLQKNLATTKSIIRRLVKPEANDPFQLNEALKQFEIKLTTNNTADIMNAHLSLLNALDAHLTSAELSKGNRADYLQTIYIQKDVISQLLAKRKSSEAQGALSSTEKFIGSAEHRKVSIKNYPDYVKEMLPVLRACIDPLANKAELTKLLDTMNQSLVNPTTLQKAHLSFLLSLRSGVNSLK